MKNKLKCRFKIIKETNDYMLIKDLYDEFSPTMTVTNDAENVVKHLYDNKMIGIKRLFYIDTNGEIDELVHHNGDFRGFKPGQENWEMLQ